MPLHQQRMDWMPSPPLVPDDGPIDLDHLREVTFGDVELEREVLDMFSTQAVRLVGALATLPPEAGALAHKLKGSARAIGAFRVADAADVLESTIRDGGDPQPAFAEVRDAAAEARTAIEAILRQR
jgi:HPt (histidine-containing phosphotransfer) domain-containing protein